MTLFLFAYGRRNRRPNFKQQAFTILELMLTLSISLTLVVTAIPNFSALLSNNRLKTLSSELKTTLAVARNHAISNQETVIVCAAANAAMTACVNRPKRNINWQNGWLAFSDANGNKQLDDADTIITARQNTSSTGMIFNQNGVLRFFPDGHARSAGFYLCEQNSTKGMHLRLLYTGRARLNTNLNPKRHDLCISSLRS